MATRFYLEKRSDKSGDHPIRVSISLTGQRFVTSTGYSIAGSKWDDKKEQVSSGCSNSKGITAKTINAHIKDISAYFAGLEADAIRNNIKVDVRAEFTAKYRPSEVVTPATFFDYIDKFVAEKGRENDWTRATVQKFEALKNHLDDFDKDLTFEKLDKSGLSDFVDFLRHDVVIGKSKGMRNSTIGKQLGFLKWFLRWAVAENYSSQTDFQTFSPKLKTSEKKVVFLTWDELMTIYNAVIPENKKYLERVRDVFCFCSFTSLRYSDVANLRRSDIFPDHISVTTIKTADSLTIDLNDYSRAILHKYKKERYPKNLALPVISNQRMNEYLKELGEFCKIDAPTTITYYKGNQRYDEIFKKWELMGTHTARRTFISNAIMMGIPPQVVMKWTGHSDYKSMKPYIDIADQAKADAMQMFNKK